VILGENNRKKTGRKKILTFVRRVYSEGKEESIFENRKKKATKLTSLSITVEHFLVRKSLQFRGKGIRRS